MAKPVYGVMVIWWNFPKANRFFGTHFHLWQNGEMVKKSNNTMNFMVRFNCCMGYQLCFSLLYFWPARQLWPSWRVWGSSHVLYLVSAGLPPILSCHLSVFPMVKWFNGEIIPDGAVMMVRLFCCGDSICVLEWILLLEWFFSPGTIFLGGNCGWSEFPLHEGNPGGHVPGDVLGSFLPPGKLLTTLDTILGRKLSCEISWGTNSDSAGRQSLVFAQFYYISRVVR